MERLLGVRKGQFFIWECHDCHEGVVIPGAYTNSHGQKVAIDPKRLEPDAEVFRF
jgi:hypothetical protein